MFSDIARKLRTCAAQRQLQTLSRILEYNFEHPHFFSIPKGGDLECVSFQSS